jgi:hypothetical protein
LSDEIDICNRGMTIFAAEHALFDMVPDRKGYGRIVAACSPEHMLALGGHVYQPASEPPAD